MSEQTAPSATKFLEALAGTERVTILDGECVDSVKDYEHVIECLLRGTSAGDLTLTHFEGIEGARRTLTIAINAGAKHRFEVEGDTDWLDNAAFVGGIGEVLRGIGYARRLLGFWSPDELGQSIGFAMLTDAQMSELYLFGFEVNRTITLYLGANDVLDPANDDVDGERVGDPAAWEEAYLRS